MGTGSFAHLLKLHAREFSTAVHCGKCFKGIKASRTMSTFGMS